MAYNSLKDVEADLLRRIQELRATQKSRRKRDSIGQKAFGFVSTAQFFGMDTDPFAVELARVTLMIARKMAHDRLGLTEQELPLDNLDANIVAADALFTPWPAADAIVGNPPFLGGKHLRLNLGDAYCDRVFARFAAVRDSVDFCSYWFRLAHDALGPGGRAGLVATNSIRHGKSRRATLEYIQQHGGHIHQAISSQPWSGEANVHVSIVNWSRERPQSCRLDGEEVAQINTSLRATADVSEAVRLQANRSLCFQGGDSCRQRLQCGAGDGPGLDHTGSPQCGGGEAILDGRKPGPQPAGNPRSLDHRLCRNDAGGSRNLCLAIPAGEGSGAAGAAKKSPRNNTNQLVALWREAACHARCPSVTSNLFRRSESVEVGYLFGYALTLPSRRPQCCDRQ